MAPVPIEEGVTYPEFAPDCVETTKALAREYAFLAVAEQVDFLDAGGCELTKADHVHLTAKGHRQLAERMETAVREILETLQGNWRKIMLQTILIVGVVLGMSYTRFLDRIASVISMKDIYFYISGTGALAGTQVLENIAERFSILVTFHEPDLLIIPISFLVFELLRVCFDSKMTLT